MKFTDQEIQALYELKVKYPQYRYIAKDNIDNIWLYQIKPIKVRWFWLGLFSDKPILVDIDIDMTTNEIIDIDYILEKAGIEIEYI